jgi:hypothetical protein
VTDIIELIRRDLSIVNRIIELHTPRMSQPGCSDLLARAYAMRNDLQAALEVARHE